MKSREEGTDWGVAEEAALWVVRLNGTEVERYQREFERWYAESEQHRYEFLLARATDRQLDALKNLIPRIGQSLAAYERSSKVQVVPIRKAAIARSGSRDAVGPVERQCK